ncbi:MAG: IS630 family transposase [Thermoleophilia bacterium]
MRTPSVFVRDLGPGEGRLLKQMSRTAKHFATRQRAQILLASAAAMAPADIARALSTDESHVRKVIKAFNEEGFESLRPRYRGGRPRKVDQAAAAQVVKIALDPPQVSGVPLTRWSLRRLLLHLIATGILEAGVLSVEGLRILLSRSGATFQRTRTWKVSTDPNYRAKRDRIRRLYARAEAGTLKNAVVVCFDEFGPCSIRPQQGAAWARRKRPTRLRSDYNRKHGVRYLFGAYDVGADVLWGEMSKEKDAVRVLEFLKSVRSRYALSVRIYLVMDNLSTHWTSDIRRWARKNRVTLVPTPTYASYLNRIECHFWALAEFCIRNSDYPDHDALEKALMDHIAYRNAHRDDARILKLVSRRKVA